MTTYSCCNEQRRQLLSGRPDLNGIDYLEVDDDNQSQLYLHFVNDLQQDSLTPSNFLIQGGERITGIAVTNVTLGDEPKVVVLAVSSPGDFSPYTLSIVADSTKNDLSALPEYDPILSTIEFSFKINCPSDFDCKSDCSCPPEIRIEPEIDYLAKDYSSFRQLMLDRLALLSPQWQERSPADIGIALVELLAYVGDYLSYEQDAIGTESYLQTARRRVSVRRHTRLVDYFMHDGCNARAWVHFFVTNDDITIPQHTQLLTKTSLANTVLEKDSPGFQKAISENPKVFETMDAITCFTSHNLISFYTYGDQACCLPKGATEATLLDNTANPLQLNENDVLLFEELIDPTTGDETEKDMTHRYVVRLTSVQTDIDLLTNMPFVKIQWSTEDALPFPLCINALIEDENGRRVLKDVSVARGNIALADHGCTINPEEALTDGPNATVPQPSQYLIPVTDNSGCRCQQPATNRFFPRFRPQLKQYPLTQAGTIIKTTIKNGEPQSEQLSYDAEASAASALVWEMKDVMPAIKLNNNTWLPKRDLLSSSESDLHFVVEVEENGIAYLRFSNNTFGKAPDPGTGFTASYRVGNGTAGNVAAESISHILDDGTIVGIDGVLQLRNPLPAQGGIDPESIEHVRQCAPFEYLTQERAVTEQDYSDKACLYQENNSTLLQKAETMFRWTGSWHTACISIDPLKSQNVDDKLPAKIENWMERYRMAGVDIEVEAPIYVPLEIVMQICVKANYFRSDVEKVLCEIFSDGILPDGHRGIFHPDNFTFGQTVYLSPLYRAALEVDGVDSVLITTFRRQDDANSDGTTSGKLEMGRLEIPRLDNDPNYSDHGTFTLIMQGGK